MLIHRHRLSQLCITDLSSPLERLQGAVRPIVASGLQGCIYLLHRLMPEALIDGSNMLQNAFLLCLL